MLTRRAFLSCSATGALTLGLVGAGGERVALALAPTGTPEEPPHAPLAASAIPQFRTPLVIPPTMPRAQRIGNKGNPIDYYEIAVRQFSQQILPAGLPATTVWGYGPAGGGVGRQLFHAPSMTIEATRGVPVRIKWINQLRDAAGKALPHLLPVDPTLHWANPERRPGMGGAVTDTRPDFTGLTYVPPSRYTDPATQYTLYRGPVPLVTHLHGALGVGDESDGYPEAWYLPEGVTPPAGYAGHGAWYEFFAAKAKRRFGVTWEAGSQVSQYPNDNRACTLWFHDHTLGLTRQNVYAGPAGFYLMRDSDGDSDDVVDTRTGRRALLPGPSVSHPHNQKQILDIPIAIQDRSFNADGSLFYPDTRAFFDGNRGPYVPQSPVPPAWNPEFFANTLVVNGNTWPYLEVERRRYRLRFLNGCNSRFLILDFGDVTGVQVWQIGNDGGHLPEAFDLGRDGLRLLLGPAERADLLVDFTAVPEGSYLLKNLGPDEPFGGGEPERDFDRADPATTGRVLQFRVGARRGTDVTTPGAFLRLPVIPALPASTVTRRVALMEHTHGDGDDEGPIAALLGVVEQHDGRPHAEPRTWMDPVTENPAPGATETWEIYNFTPDAHPVHVHEVAFAVDNRQDLGQHPDEPPGEVYPPRPGETGRKDTVIARPHEVTRVRATFSTAGQYVWHCHILEHEDNEMMRPFRIGGEQPGQPASHGDGHPHP